MVKRDLYMNKISRLVDKDIIKIITGVRRCGKSYMLNLIIEKLIDDGVKKSNILLINFENPMYQHINTIEKLNDLVLNCANNISQGKLYLFFDEIQNVNGWQRAVNGYIATLNCDIYVTGSNSKLLSTEYATYLTGRYMEIKMYPFSFNEYLDYKIGMLDDNLNNNLLHLYERQVFDEYLKYGGMPFTLKIDEIDRLDYLDDLFNSIIYKDLIQRYNIRDIDFFKRLIIYILDNIGNLFSSNSISKFLKHENINVSHTTIKNYLEYLENSCLILKASRKDIVGKKLLKVNEKYYVVDTGFISATRENTMDNIGHIIENIVYLEFLRHNYKVYVGKYNNYEVDFLCENHESRVYVQVTTSLIDENVNKREFRPLFKIKDNYPKYVISMDTIDFSREGIIHLNLMDFLKNFI